MTAETIGDIKTNTDANTRAIIIGKLNYKLNLEDSNFQSDKEIGKAWLKGIKRQLDNYDIVEDDQRVGACVRNLTGYVEDLAEHHGKFDLFDAFEKWFNKTLRIPEQPEDIAQELKTAVQTGKFRPYGKLFLAISAKNLRCKFPRSEKELRDVFLANMRNNRLRMALLTVPGDLGDLVALAEELIHKGQIFDYNDSRANGQAGAGFKVEKPIPSGPASTRGRNFDRRNFKGNNNNRRSQYFREASPLMSQQQLHRLLLERGNPPDQDDEDSTVGEGAPLKG